MTKENEPRKCAQGGFITILSRLYWGDSVDFECHCVRGDVAIPDRERVFHIDHHLGDYSPGSAAGRTEVTLDRAAAHVLKSWELKDAHLIKSRPSVHRGQLLCARHSLRLSPWSPQDSSTEISKCASLAFISYSAFLVTRTRRFHRHAGLGNRCGGDI